jgi:hypothetical protein
MSAARGGRSPARASWARTRGAGPYWRAGSENRARQPQEAGAIYDLCPDIGLQPGRFAKFRAAERFQAGPQHLAPLTEGRRRDPFQGGQQGPFRSILTRNQMDHGAGDLGWRGEGGGGQVHDQPGLANRLRNDREPPIGIVSGRGDDPLGHLFLEHQGQGVRGPWPGQPFDQQGRADIVGQVGHHMGRSLDQFSLAHLQGVCLDHGQPSGSVVQLGQKRQEARILLDQHHPARIALQQGARQSSGTGADLDHGPTLERPRQPDDLPGDVQIQQKMLAEALLRQQAVGVEGFAKGGEVGGVHRCVIAGRRG